jgi:hypothetical protein
MPIILFVRKTAEDTDGDIRDKHQHQHSQAYPRIQREFPSGLHVFEHTDGRKTYRKD